MPMKAYRNGKPNAFKNLLWSPQQLITYVLRQPIALRKASTHHFERAFSDPRRLVV